MVKEVELTSEQQVSYASGKHTTCPKCGSPDVVEFTNSTIINSYLYNYYTCYDCDFDWTDIYSYTKTVVIE